MGNKIVLGPGEDGGLLVSPEFRNKSRKRALVTCCALPSERSTLPWPRWSLSVQAGVCVLALKFVPRATAPTFP